MNQQLYTLLLRSLDESLTESEQSRLDKALAQSSQLQQEKKRLLEMRTQLNQQAFHFQPFFAGKVMNQIKQKTKESKGLISGLNYAFLRVSLPALAVCIILFLFTYASQESLSLDTLTGVSGLSFDELMNDLFVSN